jgi:predicted nucleic acid-binding protein
VRCFLDSNIWLYAFIRAQHQEKSEIAKAIIQNNEIITRTQVINEVSINLIKKARFDESRTRSLIASFYEQQEVIEPGLEVLLEASTM